MSILQQRPVAPQHVTFVSACCKLLRGERMLWPFGYDPVVVDNFISEIIFHGVDCLVYDRLGQVTDCPARLRSELQQRAIGRAAWELRNRAFMQDAISRLSAAGIERPEQAPLAHFASGVEVEVFPLQRVPAISPRAAQSLHVR